MNKNVENHNLNFKKNIKNHYILNKKTIGNAVCSYLMLFVSGFFLINKTNSFINNDFVKGHTKSALLIHLGFLLTYIIFVFFSLFGNIIYLGLSLNNIMANFLFLFLLLLLLLGIYKANQGIEFNILKKINISKQYIYLNTNSNLKITEKEKITIFLSYIPIIGFLNYGKHQKNILIKEGVGINLFISSIITLLYIFGYGNLANLASLSYIIFISFIGINIFTRNELIQINFGKYLFPEYLLFLLKYSYIYFYKYFQNNNFKEFNIVKKEYLHSVNENELLNNKKLLLGKDTKIPTFLIYIPFINLIFLFLKNTKYSFHIINGLTITVLLFIYIIISYFININSNLYLLFIFPILFGIGNIKYRLAYKLPFVYDIYVLFNKSLIFIKSFFIKIKNKRNETNEVTLKSKNI